jgi:hypothetical protein
MSRSAMDSAGPANTRITPMERITRSLPGKVPHDHVGRYAADPPDVHEAPDDCDAINAKPQPTR